jgi:hypothetical protein
MIRQGNYLSSIVDMEGRTIKEARYFYKHDYDSMEEFTYLLFTDNTKLILKSEYIAFPGDFFFTTLEKNPEIFSNEDIENKKQEIKETEEIKKEKTKQELLNQFHSIKKQLEDLEV